MIKKLKSGQWVGSLYVRGGSLKDKHGNITKKPITLRQIRTGYILNKEGQWIGVEPVKRHSYGFDPIRRKKPKGWTFVRPNRLGSVKPRSSHLRQLK